MHNNEPLPEENEHVSFLPSKLNFCSFKKGSKLLERSE